jgi:hypothetical protein
MVEAPPVGPPAERARGALLAIRGQMPLTERRRAVAVALQHLRERRAVFGDERRVSGEPAGQLADRPEPHRVVIAVRQRRRPGRRAQRRHMKPVIADSLLSDPGHGRSGDRAAERARLAEARIINQHQQDVRRALGRRNMPDQAPVRLRPFQGPVRHTREPRVRDRQPGTVNRVIGHACLLSPMSASPQHTRGTQPRKIYLPGISHDHHSKNHGRCQQDRSRNGQRP